jgi:RNA polymerase sigma-70 factor (ECF subfamily)
MMDRIEKAMAELRPQLHRFAARMMGSAFDGEDAVQDALAKALAARDAGVIAANPEAWLFAVTHNAVLDALRKRRRRAAREAAAMDEAPAATADSRAAASAGLRTFLRLPPAQRATVILADVLGHSLDEIAGTLGMSLAAVKAALHRGRKRLRELASEGWAEVRSDDDQERARLQAYADRFNAHDWDALRALLAEDVRLDLVARTELRSAREVGVYFTRYAEGSRWHVSVGTADGRPALLYSEAADASPAFVVLLEWQGDRIAAIRDFHYARYIMDSLAYSG